MATRLRGPLSIALAIALLPLAWATRGAWTAPFKHTSSHITLPSTGATASPVSRPTPRPTPLASLLAADRFDLGAPRAYGRIDVVGFDHNGDTGTSGYRLAATPPSMPSSLPVWKLRGFVGGADTAALIARLGIHPLASPNPNVMSDGSIDAAAASVSAGNGGYTTVLSAGRPANDAAAMAAASQLLVDLGLFPQNADATATSTTDMGPAGWSITYTHRPIDGVPVGFGFWTQGVASMEISELGNVTRFNVEDPAVDGGAAYPLRSWRDAWADVSRGHWFDECCDVNTGGGGPPLNPVFHAGTVSLVYEQVAMYLVPMYEFTDTAGRLSLTIPALRLTDLAEPGGFRLTQPGGA